jgi:DNA-binding beta-propeller fold protein YncE
MDGRARGPLIRRLVVAGCSTALSHKPKAGRSHLFVVFSILLGTALLSSAAPAMAARGHVFSASFGEPCSPAPAPCGPGQLDEPAGVAVNETTGDVYVVDKGDNRVERFSSAGTYLGQFDGSGSFEVEGTEETDEGAPTGQFLEPESIAVDNSCQLHKPEPLTEATTPTCGASDPSDGEVYVADVGHNVLDKFTSTGQYIGQLTETPESTFGRLEGVGVDASGSLWLYLLNEGLHGGNFAGEAATFTNAPTNDFVSPSHVLAPVATVFAKPGFAIDSEDDLYTMGLGERVAGNTVTQRNSEGEALVEEVDHESSTGIAVDLSSNDVYIDNATTVGVFSSSGEPLERLGSGDLTSGSGIGVNSTAEEVYVADQAADRVDIFAPNPPGPPTVESESVSEVTSSSATLSALINPRGADTEYHFEFGPCMTSTACTGSVYEESVPIRNANIGPGFDIQKASVHPSDLSSATEYHFRVVTQNELGPAVDGPNQTFNTQTTGGELALPDGRAWELVTPPDKHGAQLHPIYEQGGVVQASVDGSAITYVASGPIEAEPKGSLVLDTQVLSRRGPDGWSSLDIATPHEVANGNETGHETEYQFFSADLLLGLVEPFGATPLAPDASEKTIYLRDNTSDSYLPLVTAANVPPSTKFGGEEEGGGEITFDGATSGLSHVVLDSTVALTPQPVDSRGLYEWAGGQLRLVSVLPGPGEQSAADPALGDRTLDVRHAISEDGSRIVWEAGGGREAHLYMRDTVKGETVQLDGNQGAAEPGEGTPEFQTANGEGSKVFFTDSQRLTADSTASGNGDGTGPADLYECEMVEDADGKLSCDLTDLTVAEHVGEHAGVQGTVIGASETGSDVYFVAQGVLSAAQNDEHETAVSGASNLYMSHDSGRGWATTFIATLSSEDKLASSEPGLIRVPARVSPDGEYLAFMSDRSLTGYDNQDVNSGARDEEVFLFDARSGHLVCASCNPTGARPVGIFDPGGFPQPLIDGPEIWPRRWLAGSIPGWTGVNIRRALYQSRYLSNSGRLFFNSAEGLVPQDKNGLEDVYEYEPAGEGSCASSSPTFSERSGGCVGLISSGTSSEESAFLDASAGGDDVFFLTASKLVPRDVDTSLDIYDAHVCSEGAPCVAAPAASPPCETADSCRPAPLPAPQVFGAPASANFAGAGNLAPRRSASAAQKRARALKKKRARELKMCRRKPKKERAACNAQAKKRFRTTGEANGKKSARRGK